MAVVEVGTHTFGEGEKAPEPDHIARARKFREDTRALDALRAAALKRLAVKQLEERNELNAKYDASYRELANNYGLK